MNIDVNSGFSFLIAVSETDKVCVYFGWRERYTTWVEACTFVASLCSSRMRVVHISGFVLGCEELGMWVWTGLSSQKVHELKQDYNNNFVL